jgi:hypothetical protein
MVSVAYTSLPGADIALAAGFFLMFLGACVIVNSWRRLKKSRSKKERSSYS